MFATKSNNELLRRIDIRLVQLIAAHIILLILAIYAMTMDIPNYRWPRWQSMFIEVMGLSQISLLSIWCILGRSLWNLRISMLLIGVTFWVVTLRACGLNQERWLTIALMQVVGISLILLAVRYRGYKLVDVMAEDNSSIRKQVDSSRLHHFSLFQLMVVVSVLSLFLGMSQKLFSYEAPSTLNRDDYLRAPGLAISLALLANTVLWSTLYVKKPINRYHFSVIFVLLFACWGVGKVDQLYRTSWWSSLGPHAYEKAYWILLALYTLNMFLSLRVVRLTGFRIEKSPDNIIHEL